MLNIEAIAEILNSSERYNSYVYTGWRDVVSQLIRRREDIKLKAYVDSVFQEGIPSFMRDEPAMVYFRNVATPNYEMYRFMICADVLQELRPLVFEYSADKFADINEFKRSLGKMTFYKRLNRKLEPITTHTTIIDMSKWNGKKISDIHTFEGESLVDYHHALFFDRFPHMKGAVHDVSAWITHDGTLSAKQWYKRFLSLFLVNGVLFENFMTSRIDISLTRDAVLPAIAEIENECGYRPLIVALEPTHIEGDAFWHSYPSL